MKPWDKLLIYWTKRRGRSGLTLQFLAAACHVTPQTIMESMVKSGGPYLYQWWWCSTVLNPVCAAQAYTLYSGPHPELDRYGSVEIGASLYNNMLYNNMLDVADAKAPAVVSAIVSQAEEKIALGKPSRNFIKVITKRGPEAPEWVMTDTELTFADLAMIQGALSDA